MRLSVLYTLSSALATTAVALDASVLELRGLPADATGVTTITSPGGVTIRYKQPGKEGVCETTTGVNSYSGYVDLDADNHMFFWFFESRHDSANAPLTLWLNGGPGSDSLIGLFQELGPCNVTADYRSQVNPYAWNEVSNLLFLSQPIGVGFSYSGSEETSTGRYPTVNGTGIYRTTDAAAIGTWHVLQGLLANLPQLDPTVKVKKFNLWTESYGGHYGPAFFDYFSQQNDLIGRGQQSGTVLVMDTLGIGNGIIDEEIQAPYYPEFAVNNTYGIKAVNDTVYQAMKDSFYNPGGCRDQVSNCKAANRTSTAGQAICSRATSFCRNNVEGPYYDYSGRGVYDIRHPYEDPTPPTYFIKYLNQASTQGALGVNFNYTSDSSYDVGNAFRSSGDFVYPTFITDLEDLLNSGVRVALYYGDADFICNWFGGQAVSLAVNYTHSAEFRAAEYAPFVVDGTEYGEVRQYGNFSFLRIYEAGHEVPYYQPVGSLEFFRRVLSNLDIASGTTALTGTYQTNGTATATHTENPTSLVATPTRTSSVTPSQSSSAATRGIRMFWRR